jgi:hypothetical protein
MPLDETAVPKIEECDGEQNYQSSEADRRSDAPIERAGHSGQAFVHGGEVLVLHLPRMIERVEGGVSDEEGQRPRQISRGPAASNARDIPARLATGR